MKMRLFHLSKHLKDQNWFAVALEFLIVVVGVFLGLQVQEWNEARKERVDERALLSRLHLETRELLAVNREQLAAQRARSDPLASATPVLFSQVPARPLTIAECEAIAGSHVYRLPSDELPVLDEILATGRFDILHNEAVRQQLRDFILFRERARSEHAERTNELFRLYSRHADLITITRAPLEENYEGRWAFEGDGYRWVVQCDVVKMRVKPAFLNEYVDNVVRSHNVVHVI